MGRNVDNPRAWAIARLAAQQYGVISLAQLQALGQSASGVRNQAARARLRQVHRGVYAVGHAPLVAEGVLLAAVLACGPGAALSHLSAAGLLDLRPTSRAAIDVTTRRGAARRRAGISAHASGTLRPQDVTTVRSIPCTTVARTLLDLADVIRPGALERALERAEMLRVLDTRAVEEQLANADGRRGAPTLARLISEIRPETHTRSEFEDRFLSLCCAAGIPRPKVNAQLALGDKLMEADFLWPNERLIVESDGYAAHGTRRAFERDRRRDALLLVAGYRTVRVTWGQLRNASAEVAATVAALFRSEKRE